MATILKRVQYDTMEDTFVRVMDLKVRIRRQERPGTPLLLINGLGACLEAWEPLTRLLQGRDIIAVDHPGCGLSSPPNHIMTMPEIAMFYTEVLKTVAVDEADVLGFSFGGTIAQQIAKDYPEFVRSLILAGTAPGTGGFPADPITIMTAANPLRYVIPLVREMAAPIIYRGRCGRHPRLFETELSGWDAHRTTLLGVGAQTAAFAGWSSLSWLAMIDKPTLVLGGEEDPMAPVANSRLIASVIPGAELRVFDQGGHLFLFDMAEQAAPPIKDFLERVDASTRD
ncbi:alpha/beta fold hydrolase [Janibacter sp. GXQ6167]|uniref:alpha/beta fold hydrolase n=1 Tax=Janibacter sp. GXQ6167 TaxID=3240791 RepID=UPI003526BBFD